MADTVYTKIKQSYWMALLWLTGTAILLLPIIISSIYVRGASFGRIAGIIGGCAVVFGWPWFFSKNISKIVDAADLRTKLLTINSIYILVAGGGFAAAFAMMDIDPEFDAFVIARIIYLVGVIAMTAGLIRNAPWFFPVAMAMTPTFALVFLAEVLYTAYLFNSSEPQLAWNLLATVFAVKMIGLVQAIAVAGTLWRRPFDRKSNYAELHEHVREDSPGEENGDLDVSIRTPLAEQQKILRRLRLSFWIYLSVGLLLGLNAAFALLSIFYLLDVSDSTANDVVIAMIWRENILKLLATILLLLSARRWKREIDTQKQEVELIRQSLK